MPILLIEKSHTSIGYEFGQRNYIYITDSLKQAKNHNVKAKNKAKSNEKIGLKKQYLDFFFIKQI